MSSLRSAGLLLGRVAAVGAVGAAAAVGTLWSSSRRSPAPASLPVLAEDPPSRGSQLAALAGSSPASPFDVLVIGGGATGSGVALDAATRGLRVALVERNDFSSGTSSRSTKLVHGGVRYLEKAVLQADLAQLRLVHEALKERSTLLHNAPHLTWPLPTVMPCYSWLSLPYVWAGLKLYDLIAGPNLLFPSRFVTLAETHALIPTLADTTADGQTLVGSLVYVDGQMDDSRVNIAVAMTAARAGAALANHCEVIALSKDAATGLVTGASVRDTLTGQTVEVHAKVTINATGVYSDRIRELASPDIDPIVCTSSGTHIVLPEFYLGRLGSGGAGLIIPKTKDGRVLFALPWLGGVVAGTTDEPCEVTDSPLPKAEEVSFIINTLKEYLDIDIKESDVLSEWTGLRPLIQNKSSGGSTENIVREHAVLVDNSTGLITITGGKWTTYRSMAEETVDRALVVARELGLPLSPARSHSVTEHIPLTGADGYHKSLSSQLAQSSTVVARGPDGKARPKKLESDAAKHLASSYGFRALKVVDIASTEGLGTPLSGNHPHLEAEVVYCARYEMCATAADFLLNRSRLAFLDAQGALDAAPRVVELLGKEFGWTSGQRKQELDAALAQLEAFKAPQLLTV